MNNNKNLSLILINHLISNHKPDYKLSWFFYLSGIIQGFSKISYFPSSNRWISFIDINIYFDLNDISLIYTLKHMIGSGSIQIDKILNKINYSISNPKGVLKIYELTKNKFIFKQLNLLSLSKYGPLLNEDIIKLNLILNYKNYSYNYNNNNTNYLFNLHYSNFFQSNFKHNSHYWFSGFLDTSLSNNNLKLNFKSINYLIDFSKINLLNFNLLFELYFINKSYLTLKFLNEFFGISLINLNYYSYDFNIKIHKIEINLRLYKNINKSFIDYNNNILNINKYWNKKYLIKNELISLYNYSLSLNFTHLKLIKLLKHLDTYSLLSYKFIKYLKLRKIYRISQRKENLNKKNFLKILSLWNLGY
jgi:hypothetical protein